MENPRPSCTHKTLTLQETDTGYLTGHYVCVRCGEKVLQVGATLPKGQDSPMLSEP
jgi:hypothetical protein